MSAIRGKIDSVTNYVQDWYDTPGGLKQMYCACTPYVPCLYHFYVAQNGGKKPRSDYQHGQGAKEPHQETAGTVRASLGRPEHAGQAQKRSQAAVSGKPGVRSGKPSRKLQKTR